MPLVGVVHKNESSEESEVEIDAHVFDFFVMMLIGKVFSLLTGSSTSRAFLTQYLRRVSTRKPEDLVLQAVQSQLPYSHPSLSTLWFSSICQSCETHSQLILVNLRVFLSSLVVGGGKWNDAMDGTLDKYSSDLEKKTEFSVLVHVTFCEI